VRVRLETLPDRHAVAARAAELIAHAIHEATDAGGRFAWAISGGRDPVPMFERLSELDLPWARVDTWQVDERVAPAGHQDRNLTSQLRALAATAVALRPMPVEEEDLAIAARAYAAQLPSRFDVVHLGLGADGHTASLVPGDPVLDVRDRTVDVTDPYQGRRRMTLTYPGLALAARAIWVVTGPDKRDALEKLLDRDPSIPASGVDVADQVLLTDVPDLA
jgi:6-phosphogluconolactonase